MKWGPVPRVVAGAAWAPIAGPIEHADGKALVVGMLAGFVFAMGILPCLERWLRSVGGYVCARLRLWRASALYASLRERYTSLGDSMRERYATLLERAVWEEVSSLKAQTTVLELEPRVVVARRAEEEAAEAQWAAHLAKLSPFVAEQCAILLQAAARRKPQRTAFAKAKRAVLVLQRRARTSAAATAQALANVQLFAAAAAAAAAVAAVKPYTALPSPPSTVRRPVPERMQLSGLQMRLSPSAVQLCTPRLLSEMPGQGRGYRSLTKSAKGKVRPTPEPAFDDDDDLYDA